MVTEDQEEKEEFIQIINANNELLLKLINDILDLSKIEAGSVELKYEDFDLAVYFNELAASMHHRAVNPQVRLVPVNPYETCTVRLDKNRLAQILTNFVTNAIKYTSKGTIEMGYEKIDENIRLYVRDTGIGIPEDKKDKVFHRFEKLDEFAQGTGLGLSICKSIVERLGGKITVNSEFGVGTTFNFTLPYNIIKKAADTTEGMQSSLSSQSSQLSQSSQPSDLTEQPSNETPQEQIPEKQACILIAEDTDSNYDLLNAILGKNYRLVHAHDGMEAVIMYDEVKPDLILMDIKMPNLDGLEATKIIRELSATVPIVVQSAYAYPQDQKAAKEAGCSDFISKPIVQSELKKMLNKWLSPELNNKIQE